VRWRTLGLLGDPAATEPRLEEDGSLLVVPNADTYETLPAKIHAALTWIHRTWPRCPGVFKTDDDMVFPNRDQMERTIRMNRSIPYWGLYVSQCPAAEIPRARIASRFADTSVRAFHQAARYCFGAGYWIGAPALPVIAAAEEDFRTSTLEDVCMGYVLNRVGIFPQKIMFPHAEVPRGPELLRAK
jgi:hypothetical protein